MRKASVEGIIKYVEQDVFHIFGVPETIHSDNGKQFVSVSFQKFLKTYDVQHIKTAFYASQANAAERVNRSILQIIQSYVAEDQKMWDTHLTDVAFSLRSADT